MSKLVLLTVAAAVLVFVSPAVAEDAQTPPNLVPDPDFSEVDFAPLAEETTWRWYEIVLPCDAELDEENASVTLSGGKVFLHSSAFDVEPGRIYDVSVQAAGKGTISVECLWWVKYEDSGLIMADPHRTVPIEPAEVVDEAEMTVSGQATAPENAKRMYIRIVVEDGEFDVSAPAVRAAAEEQAE
jgi:hypothetical protein